MSDYKRVIERMQALVLEEHARKVDAAEAVTRRERVLAEKAELELVLFKQAMRKAGYGC